jgi:hypothetical protein
MTNVTGIKIEDFTKATTTCEAIEIDAGAVSPTATKQNIVFVGGDWNTGHLQLGTAHIWYDGTNIRGKTSAPTSSGDGTAIV